MNFVFVYGSLKEGYWNHSVLQDSGFITTATTCKKFNFHTCGFPYMHEYGAVEERMKVHGELYEVTSDEVMEDLDSLEGHPYHYQRSYIRVKPDGSDFHLPVITYIPSDPSFVEGLSVCESYITVDNEQAYRWTGN